MNKADQSEDLSENNPKIHEFFETELLSFE